MLPVHWLCSLEWHRQLKSSRVLQAQQKLALLDGPQRLDRLVSGADQLDEIINVAMHHGPWSFEETDRVTFGFDGPDYGRHHRGPWCHGPK